VVFDPAGQEFPVAFDILRSVFRNARHLAASGIVAALKSVWRTVTSNLEAATGLSRGEAKLPNFHEILK
jgi:hypothetical protein